MVRTQNQRIPITLVKLGLLAATMLAVLWLAPTAAYAHDGNDDSHDSEAPAEQIETSAQAEGFIPEHYLYLVESGQNQTLLVRRSAQLYDLADGSLELSPAQLIYVEHHVVKDMGARDLIYPQESIEVMSKLIAKYAAASQELSPAALAAWQAYAEQVDIELDDITPQNAEVVDGQVVPADEGAEDAPEFTADNETLQEDDSQNDSDWYWWLVAAAVAAFLWYGWLGANQPEAKSRRSR